MSAPYYLAVDVRAQAATAAIAEGGRFDAVRTDAVPLGESSTMPTAVFVAPDDLVFGDDAVVRGRAEPERLIGDFVSLIPDPAAVIVVDGEEFAPAALYAWMIDAVVTRVTRLRGAPPLATWAVVPVHWDDECVDAILDALDRDGHADVDVITVPDALTSRYAQVEPFDADLTLLLCDMDERALAAAVVRATPEGRSRVIGAPIVAPLSGDAGARAARDTHALDAIVAGLADAGVVVDDLDAILLSGPSTELARMEGLLADRFGDPIGTDSEPALAAALGAVLALAQEEIALRGHAPALVTGAPVAVVSTANGRPATDTHVVAAVGRGRRWYRRPVGLLALGAASLVLAGAAFGSIFVLDAVASSGEGEAVPSPSRSVATLPSGASTGPAAPSATPSSTPAPTSAPTTAPVPPEVGAAPPQTPSNPRIPSTSSPRVAPAPAPAPPAAVAPPAPPPPAAPDVVVPPAEPAPDPVDTPAPESVETTQPEPVETTAPTPDSTETGTPAPEDSATPAPPATEDPGLITP